MFDNLFYREISNICNLFPVKKRKRLREEQHYLHFQTACFEHRALDRGRLHEAQNPLPFRQIVNFPSLQQAMASFAAARSIFRSTSARSAAARVASQAKPARSPFRAPAKSPSSCYSRLVSSRQSHPPLLE